MVTGLAARILGERDNSQGRIGTRFASQAETHGRGGPVAELYALCDLDDLSVAVRLDSAPDWMLERHDRSLCVRQRVGEAITPLQDARDTLRVCALYATRTVIAEPFPAWLAIPSDSAILDEQEVDIFITAILLDRGVVLPEPSLKLAQPNDACEQASEVSTEIW